MTVRLVLLCAGATASLRAGRVPDPVEPLDEGARAKAAAVRLPGPRPIECHAGSRAAHETAALLGFAAADAPALRDADHGEWAGRPFDALPPDMLAAWMAAPERGLPGGESLDAVAARVGGWMDALPGAERRVLAVAHAAPIRAALAHALGIPVAATLAIDVAPLSVTMLSHAGRWRLRELRRS